MLQELQFYPIRSMADKPGNTEEYRRATEEDFNAIAHVWYESARSVEGAPLEMPSLNDLRSRIDLEIVSGWAVTVAVKDHEIIGFLALKPGKAVLDQLYCPAGESGLRHRAHASRTREARNAGWLYTPRGIVQSQSTPILCQLRACSC
jgi:hypothetical protein